MHKLLKTFISSVLVCCAIACFFSVSAQGYWKDDDEDVWYIGEYAEKMETTDLNESVTENTYSEHWEYWCQGASKYRSTSHGGDGVFKSGCLIVAYSKLFVEAGIVPGDNELFTPDTFYEWGLGKYFKNDDAYMWGSPYADYAREQGYTLQKEGRIYLSGYNSSRDDARIMEKLKEGYYIIASGDSHYIYVGREASLEAGKTILLDSWSSCSQNKNLVHSLLEEDDPVVYFEYYSVYCDMYDETSGNETIDWNKLMGLDTNNIILSQ